METVTKEDLVGRVSGMLSQLDESVLSLRTELASASAQNHENAQLRLKLFLAADHVSRSCQPDAHGRAERDRKHRGVDQRCIRG
jgi:hypothetical protein